MSFGELNVENRIIVGYDLRKWDVRMRSNTKWMRSNTKRMRSNTKWIVKAVPLYDAHGGEDVCVQTDVLCTWNWNH
jgi:hypothetical protein